MKYAVITCTNGVFTVQAENLTLESAKVNFHGLCQTYWNAPDVQSAYVMIADEQLDAAEGFKEYIHHEPVPEVEPEPEPEPEAE